MKIRSIFGGLAIGVLALALLALATEASAQPGSVIGRVLDEKGQPVVDAAVVLDSQDFGASNRKTNAKGEYQFIGVRSGKYSLKATKGTLSAAVADFSVAMGPPTEVLPMTLKVGGADAPVGATAPRVDPEARKKLEEQVQAMFKAGGVLVEAGKYDEAIVEFTKVAEQIGKCAPCYTEIGNTYVKKGDEAAAETAYKKAIELEPNHPNAYAALASLYNKKGQFAEATEMSTKANDLMAASGSADPVAVYNQGVILWNQGSAKAPEAQAQFEKAIALDPKMADAYYFLGMTLISQGKLADAKKPFDSYLEIAPTGKYAAEVTGILPMLK